MNGAPDTQNAIAVDKLIVHGRNEVLEWVDDKSSAQKLATILMAMANTAGGTLLVGIAGRKTPEVIGVKNDAEIIDRVLEAALSLEPALIIPVPKSTTLTDKSIVVAQIPSGMPHVYSLDGTYLYRTDTKNEPLNPRKLRQLLIRRGELSFETEIAHQTSLDDIDWEKADSYAKSLSGLADATTKDILARRGCLSMYNGTLCPTNAGILLFGKEPQRFIRNSEITAVRFAGITMSDSFTRQDIGGTLPDQIRRAETFLIDYLRRGVTLRHTMVRSERFEYPLEAARELVVNAVAHRDYSIQGDGIRLFIFKDRMEVASPGLLPGPVTIENIKDERFSRHPVIVQVLSDMGFIERLGYGVDRVIELMSKEDLRPPEFIETAGGFRVTLYNQVDKMQEQENKPSNGTPKQPSILHKYKAHALNPRQEAAIMHLNTPGNTRITNSELQKLFPDVHAETIRRDLADLVTKEILNKMGQKRGSFYVLNTQEDE